MLEVVDRPARLRGTIRVPGDKSISHRALILNAIADGPARVSGLSSGADVLSTLACLRALGVDADVDGVRGRGVAGLRPAPGPLDCGNSGTTMRLLAGLLAGRPFESTLVGDASLSVRPMERVVEPLRRMGAHAEVRPLRVGGQPLSGDVLHGFPVASAQVKSALILAALQAAGVTRIVEVAPTRSHTEEMLIEMGATVRIGAGEIEVERSERLRPLDVEVPGDISGAAFWLVAACCHPDARIELPGVGLHARRTAILDLLPVERSAEGLVASSQSGLPAWTWNPAWVPALIDELPILAVAATQREGTTTITGAAELRVKESDRIAAMTAGLQAMGAEISELADGWRISGPVRLRGARVRSFHDHRVAMALAVAGSLADGSTEIEDAECVAISYPGFWESLRSLR